MFKNILQFTLIFLIIGIALAFSTNHQSGYGDYMDYTPNSIANGTSNSVSEVLIQVGGDRPLHYITTLDADSAKMGEEIVKYGKLKDGSTSRISKYFVCTDCHNLELESENPADESPEAVLAFGMKHDIPFLPASTFYGMYNKEHWYNGDYYKKYGDLVIPTRDTLWNAIQLCATQCSQGREMESWEVRAVLHYFKSLELKISDLKFTQNELDEFGELIVRDKSAARDLLKTKYNQTNPATFGTSEIPQIADYTPSAERGKYIFNNGCLHCHDETRDITNFSLSDDKLSLRFLHKKRNKYNHYAVPHITRYGTYAISGRKQYMPLYSFEKMSKKQMLDLLYYIEKRANE